MAGLKARILGGWIGEKLLRTARVTEVRDLGSRFRLIRLTGEALRGVPVAAGDKVQVFIPDVGARTYTPFAVDADRGQFDLLAFLHGDGPATTWARSLVAGSSVRLLGPRDSIALASLRAPVALFGDETSFAVALALRALGAADDPWPTVLFEVGSLQDCEAVRRDLALPAEALRQRPEDPSDAFYAECARRLAQALSPGGTLVLTGNARSIQSLRAHLRGLAGAPAQKVKAYWSPGKSGLD